MLILPSWKLSGKHQPTYNLYESLSPRKKSMSVVPIGEVCCLILQSQSPSKLQNPGRFSIPCAVGDLHIEGALCNLGANMSLIPLSLYKRLQLSDLQPTNLTIQLTDCSVKQPVGVLEDVPI